MSSTNEESVSVRRSTRVIFNVKRGSKIGTVTNKHGQSIPSQVYPVPRVNPRAAFTPTSIPRPLPFEIERKIMRMVHGLGDIIEVYSEVGSVFVQVNYSASSHFRIFSAIEKSDETAESRRILTGWRNRPIMNRNPNIKVVTPDGAPHKFRMRFSSSYTMFFSPFMTIEDIAELVYRMHDSEKARIQHIAVKDRLWLYDHDIQDVKLMILLQLFTNLRRLILVSELPTNGIEALGPTGVNQDKVDFVSPTANPSKQKEPFSYLDRIRNIESELSAVRESTKSWLLGDIKVEVVAIERNGKRCDSDYLILNKEEADREAQLELENEARLTEIGNQVNGAEDPPSDNGSDASGDFNLDEGEDSEGSDEDGWGGRGVMLEQIFLKNRSLHSSH